MKLDLSRKMAAPSCTQVIINIQMEFVSLYTAVLISNIKSFYGISDRVALLKISSRYVEICLLQVYAPTSESSDDELEKFYFQVEEGMKQCKSNELLLVMGDFNAKVGSEKAEHVTGSHGLGVMNERGRILQERCYENELCTMNTWFQKKF